MDKLSELNELEKEAYNSGFLLRIRVRRPFKLWALKLVVAKQIDINKVQILGEMKAWAYAGERGLQLDTMTVRQKSPRGVGHLLWASTMAWALESTPCKRARLLAIYDNQPRHLSLVRYFSSRGFVKVRDVGSTPVDLPLRMIWGGAGCLMTANCKEVLEKSSILWRDSIY